MEKVSTIKDIDGRKRSCRSTSGIGTSTASSDSSICTASPQISEGAPTKNISGHPYFKRTSRTLLSYPATCSPMWRGKSSSRKTRPQGNPLSKTAHSENHNPRQANRPERVSPARQHNLASIQILNKSRERNKLANQRPNLTKPDHGHQPWDLPTLTGEPCCRWLGEWRGRWCAKHCSIEKSSRTPTIQ